MPKKRHQNKYSKPPSVASPALSISSSSRTNSEHHERSVNQILADMRRTSVNTNAAQSNAAQAAFAPSVPPALRAILQIPETPVPHARRPQRSRRDLNGRRAPPGPPLPRSWLALFQSRHAPTDLNSCARIQHWPMPGAYFPDDGSFLDMILRRMASDWETQRTWNRFYFYTMPSKLRVALIHCVSTLHEHGVSADDLKVILVGPTEKELEEYDLGKPDINKQNWDINHLDLEGAIGKSLTLRSLGDLLFPSKSVVEELQDSWDTPELSQRPTHVLPNLKRLSLAVSPGSIPPWRQLLSLSTKLATLTFLDLSGWPAPSLTPNATLATVVSQTGRTINYSGTHPYSHTLDDDWTEAVLVLKRLSKALYSLEYLDLTGCGDWFPALRRDAEADESVRVSVDWAGDWGKITTLRLHSGYVADLDSTVQSNRLWEWKRAGIAVEKHIIAQRAGRGRFITVETDTLAEQTSSW